MKILHVLPTAAPEYGGPTTWVYDVSKQLQSLGHEVTVVTCDEPQSEQVRFAEVPTIGLGPPFSSFRFSSRIKPWMEEHKMEFDAAFLHGVWEYPLASAAKNLCNSGFPVFAMTHGMLDPYFNKAHPAKKLKKTIYWKLVLAEALKQCTGVLFTCEPERDLAFNSFTPYDIVPHIIKFGCSIEKTEETVGKAAFAQELPNLSETPFILFLGRIDPKKGPDLLIPAFADVYKGQEMNLVVAGPDSAHMVNELKMHANSLGIARQVHFPGMLRGDVKAGAFQSCEAFILPSHQENFGIAVAESLAYGKPVLLTPKVNIFQIIQRAGAAIVNDDTISGTAKSLQEWANLTPDQKAEMSTKAKACYAENFEIEASALDLIRLIEFSQATQNV